MVNGEFRIENWISRKKNENSDFNFLCSLYTSLFSRRFIGIGNEICTFKHWQHKSSINIITNKQQSHHGWKPHVNFKHEKWKQKKICWVNKNNCFSSSCDADREGEAKQTDKIEHFKVSHKINGRFYRRRRRLRTGECKIGFIVFNLLLFVWKSHRYLDFNAFFLFYFWIFFRDSTSTACHLPLLKQTQKHAVFYQ